MLTTDDFLRAIYYATFFYDDFDVCNMNNFEIDRDRYKAMNMRLGGVTNAYNKYLDGTYSIGCPSIYFRRRSDVNMKCTHNCAKCWAAIFNWYESNTMFWRCGDV